MTVADDVVEVQQAIAAFNHLVDFGDGPGFAALFTDDGVLDMGHLRVAGRPALIEFATGVPERVPNSRHIVSNTWVEVVGSTAVAHSYAQVFVTPPDTPTTLRTAGLYHDQLVRTLDGWRFSERRFVADPASS